MTQGTEQSQDQQQPDPLQQLTQALQEIRQVQNFLELNKPGSMQAIKMQREAGDLVWQVIQQMQQQAQQGSQ
jgi:hypothetical protein